jgi:hypothetical protein
MTTNFLLEEICLELHRTYDARILLKYPRNIQNIFLSVAGKNYNKLKGNKVLLSLINMLNSPSKQPVTDYLSGPDEIIKMSSSRYDKTIYLFGESSHSSLSGCHKFPMLKKQVKVGDYLNDLFRTSPVFIDFYIEIGVMLNVLVNIPKDSGQRLYDIFNKMKDCFGKQDLKCDSNVRIHGIDARNITSKNLGLERTYKNLGLIATDVRMQMYVLKNRRSGVWISVKDFVLKYKDVIEVFKKVKTVDDIIKIIIDDINKDRLLEKEFRRSILKKEDIIDFFVNNHVRKELEKIHAINFFGKWFNILTTSDIFPPGLDIINIILDISTGSIMDVYAVSRMFKIFDVKKTEFYPREPRNIIYYAGNGHTIPMFKFLEKLSFSTVEKANSDVLSSCVNMKNIKQPLFS